jgi:hypothetical protein
MEEIIAEPHLSNRSSEKWQSTVKRKERVPLLLNEAVDKFVEIIRKPSMRGDYSTILRKNTCAGSREQPTSPVVSGRHEAPPFQQLMARSQLPRLQKSLFAGRREEEACRR